MRYSHHRAALIAVLLCAAGSLSAQGIAPEVVARDSILRNGGFEEGDAVPAVWARHPKEDPDNRHVRDTQVRRGGGASGLLHSTKPVTPGTAPLQFSQYKVPVRGGEALLAVFATRVDGCPSGYAGIHAYDAENNHLGFTRIDTPAEAREWTWVRQVVSLPAEARTIGFVLYAQPNGKTWYDDVALLTTPRAASVRATPKLDGRLDDACWSEKAALSDFIAGGGGRLATARTRAWCAYDDKALYVAFRCPHPKGITLPAKASGRDGDLTGDESIEIFLTPRRGAEGYAHITVNTRGAIRDARGEDVRWNSGATAAVAKEADAWSVEVAVPYDRLGVTLGTGKEWGLNLVRNDQANGETTVWSLEGMGRPARFGTVTLEPDLGRFYRVDLAGRLKDAGGRIAGLRGDLERVRRAGAPTEARLKHAAEMERRARSLEQVARTGKPAGPGGWDGTRDEAAALFTEIGEASEGVGGALFDADPAAEGFRVTVALSLQKIPRDRPVRSAPILERVRMQAARDETESFQLVVVPNRGALKGVTVDAPALRGPGGSIPLTWHRVGYVETGKPSYPAEYVGWWPDPLFPAGAFDVAEGERQPLWLTVSVPPEATPGDYQGEVAIRCAGREVRVPVELHVWDFRIPRPGTLATAFGLYAQPLSEWYHGSKPYREAITPEQYAKWCDFLGRYRLGMKNVAREFIDIEREGDGFRARLDALRTTVAPFAGTQFPPYSFCLHRLPSAPAVRAPNAKNDTDGWAKVTRAIAHAWKEAGLDRRVYIYGIDEPHPEEYPLLVEAYRKVKAAAPDYPIMQTIGAANPTELVGLVDIWCPLTPHLDKPFYAQRRQAGDTLWTYVCCSPKPPYANFFVDEPATDHRVLFWQTWQHEATGLLYWCVCWWRGLPGPPSGGAYFPDVPLRFGEDLGTYKQFKANGDGLLLYPGPNFTPWPSLRLEIIRDGIEDYEYLALLRGLVRKVKALPAGRALPPTVRSRAEALCTVPPEISRSLTHYTRDPGAILARRRHIGEMIERLSELLGDRPA